jgi:hypothetical protein
MEARQPTLNGQVPAEENNGHGFNFKKRKLSVKKSRHAGFKAYHLHYQNEPPQPEHGIMKHSTRFVNMTICNTQTRFQPRLPYHA